MNISAGLKKIKVLRNELQRKIKIRKENFIAIIPKESSLEEDEVASEKEEPPFEDKTYDIVDDPSKWRINDFFSNTVSLLIDSQIQITD